MQDEAKKKYPIQIIAQGDYLNGMTIHSICQPDQKRHLPTVMRSVAQFLEIYAQKIEQFGYGTLQTPSLEEQLKNALAAENYEEAARLRNEIESQQKKA